MRQRMSLFSERRHILLLLSQAQLGITKRVREGSITIGYYDAQPLEVARQEGTRLVTIRI